MEQKVLVFENEDDFRKLLKLNPKINGISVEFYKKILEEHVVCDLDDDCWGGRHVANEGCWNCYDCHERCVNCTNCTGLWSCENCENCHFFEDDPNASGLVDKSGLYSRSYYGC
jgi:hypothetical protein